MRKIDPGNFRRATRTTAREVNRQIVLTLIRERQPISRAELARQMNVTRGVITQLVGDLIESGTVVESETTPTATGRGRRPTMLRIRTRERLAMAIDVRFTRTFVMLSDFSGRQLAFEHFPTIVDPDRFVGELAARVRRLLAHHIFDGECEGVGLVVPGLVDRDTGVVVRAPQLGWENMWVRDELAVELGIPVVLENASLASALAQLWLGGPGEVPRDFVFVTVGDGVGTGVVMNGQLVRGHSNSAGEFGHLPLDPHGPACLCGQRGCWEVYTSNLATVARYLGREFSADEARDLVREQPLTIDEVITRARGGDARAVAAIEETGHHLGVGIAAIVNTLNPARIYVGGEITEAWDYLLPHLRRAMEPRVLTAAAAATPVSPEQFGGHPRLRGATSLVTAPIFAAPVVG